MMYLAMHLEDSSTPLCLGTLIKSYSFASASHILGCTVAFRNEPDVHFAPKKLPRRREAAM